MYEVTIAIPVYNVEPYIRKSLESALCQTFKSIEFLIIDDKGTDNSMNIVYKLKKEHIRGKDIRIVNNSQNLGLSETRNVALHEASGKYIYFLDSDDYISENCIEILYGAMIKEHVDVVVSSFQTIGLDNLVKKTNKLPYMVSHQKNELASLRYGVFHTILSTFVWNVFYDLSFLREKDVCFPQGRQLCEDIIFWFDVYPLVNSFVLLPDITYFYVIRSNSLSFYNSRTRIPLSEVKEQIALRDYGKKKMLGLKDKPYFTDMALFIIKFSLVAAFYMIKNYKFISPNLPFADIKTMLSCPLSLGTILTLKKHRGAFLLYYILSRLPLRFQKVILILLSKYYFKHNN